jgi:hypothetical protein
MSNNIHGILYLNYVVHLQTLVPSSKNAFLQGHVIPIVSLLVVVPHEVH